jgi:hypothetical protein
MPARRTRIGCLLVGVFVLSILDFRDTALARPAHQVSREGKSQSQSKSEKVEGARPRASGRGTDAATSSQTPPHLDSKQNPVEPAPALVNRQEGQGQRFHFPSPRHDFTAVPHPLARRDLQPPVRNSIGVSVPSNNINSRTALPVPNSPPIVPQPLSVDHGSTSRFGSINTRPVAPGGPARGAASLPTTSRTAAINGTGIMRRGIGSPQIGGPAH